MTDVTPEISAYREAIRSLWNNHFLRFIGRVSENDAIDLFEKASEVLFNALVLCPCGINDRAENLNCIPFSSLYVVPETLSPGCFLVNRIPSGSSYWDPAPSELLTNKITLNLIGFFDWDQFGYIDLRFLRVRISQCQQMPSLVGSDALVDVGYSKIFYREAA